MKAVIFVLAVVLAFAAAQELHDRTLRQFEPVQPSPFPRNAPDRCALQCDPSDSHFPVSSRPPATARAVPQFPRLAEVDAEASMAVGGPDNAILNGAPLKVPIIVDPFAQEPGSEAALEMDRIQKVLTMEPPSAQQPKPNPADQVDILEVLDRAAQLAKEAAKQKAAKKAAAKAAAAFKKDGPTSKLGKMSEVKKEIAALSDLIQKANQIQTELPKKKARLEALKKKLHKAATKSAQKLAGKKAGAEQKVASDVAGKIASLKAKLAKLESAKSLLNKSIGDLKKVESGAAVSPALIEQVENAW